MALAPPPDPADLDPLPIDIAPGTPVLRVHKASRTADAFDPGLGAPARFAPLHCPDGTPIPTLYAATTVAGALSESVFHDVPYRGRGKRILAARLAGLALLTLIVVEPIRLALLAGLGLRRIGVRRRDLIESGPGSYAMTAAWAVALYGTAAKPSGLLWTSRQDATASAMVLFGDRVPATALLVASAPVPLDRGPGLALIDDAATLAAITVVR